MDWIYLLFAGIFELGWPLGLKIGWSEEGIRIVPLSFSVVCMAISGALLFLAQRTIPIGTAYAVWTGLGAVGTFLIGLMVFKEPATTELYCLTLHDPLPIRNA